PVTTGVLSLVVEPSAGAVMAGASGAVVSTVKVTSSLVPLPSTTTVCSPSPRTLSGVWDQLPFSSTTTSTGAPSSMVTVIVVSGSPTPVIAGVESLVTSPSAGVRITVSAGTAVSTVKLRLSSTPTPLARPSAETV